MKVAESDVDAALERLREQTADFVDVADRGLEMEDFAVVDFEGLVDGKPINEVAPQASKNLHGGKKFWLRLSEGNFLPKFCDQLIGQKPGETRCVTVDCPADFLVKELAGKKAHLHGYVAGDQAEKVPAVDDAFAAKTAAGQNAGRTSPHDRARSRARKRA